MRIKTYKEFVGEEVENGSKEQRGMLQVVRALDDVQKLIISASKVASKENSQMMINMKKDIIAHYEALRKVAYNH